ncbi:unnamed protein product, partial [Hymenolepis diminuta]
MDLIKETPEELENNRLIISNTGLIINSIGGTCSGLNFKNEAGESEESWIRTAQMTSTPKKGYEDKSDFKKSLTPLTDSLPFSESDRVDWSSTETKESSSSTSTPSYFSRDPELLDSSSTGSRKSSSSTLTEDYLG